MKKNPEFDDIRPYYDDEVAAVIERLLNNQQFRGVLNYLYPGESAKPVEQMLRTFTNQDDFQRTLIKNFVYDLLSRAKSAVTFDGFENISKTVACTFISNHRDIILDASILCILSFDHDLSSIELAIGDNLLLADWIKDLVRLNKCFLVKRSVSGRAMFEAAMHLSKYIHFAVRDKNQSVWIAQREGRAKDSNDRTQESVLKMLAMGGDKNFMKSLLELNLITTTFSYEYDPCDYLKAKEFQQKRDNPDFKKTKEDDLLNMRTGLFGYKGKIHLQIGKPLENSLRSIDNSLSKHELATQVASIIDTDIFRNYKFYPVNYIAYDRLWGKSLFCEKYTADDIKNFDQYIQQQLDKIDLPDKDIPFLTEKMEEMYAYPVKNNYEL